jgi:lipoprotein-anchoring transpeptidase ErfK/SrfK
MKLRTAFVAVGLSLATMLAGCTTDGGFVTTFSGSYGARTDAGYRIPAIPITKVPRKFHRQVVRYDTNEKAGTIIVDTGEKFLYYVMGNGKAVRYGIGVGREGFEWKGTARIGAKREWPVWTPPPAMIRRQPELAKWRGGMPGGPQNALGARAMYLHNKGGDSGYRLHGTPEWNSIGKAMSSGCIRLMNQDVIDLYERAEVGAKVIVI